MTNGDRIIEPFLESEQCSEVYRLFKDYLESERYELVDEEEIKKDSVGIKYNMLAIYQRNEIITVTVEKDEGVQNMYLPSLIVDVEGPGAKHIRDGLRLKLVDLRNQIKME